MLFKIPGSRAKANIIKTGKIKNSNIDFLVVLDPHMKCKIINRAGFRRVFKPIPIGKTYYRERSMKAEWTGVVMWWDHR